MWLSPALPLDVMGWAALEILDRLPQTHTAVWFELIEGDPSVGLSDQNTA